MFSNYVILMKLFPDMLSPLVRSSIVALIVFSTNSVVFFYHFDNLQLSRLKGYRNAHYFAGSTGSSLDDGVIAPSWIHRVYDVSSGALAGAGGRGAGGRGPDQAEGRGGSRSSEARDVLAAAGGGAQQPSQQSSPPSPSSEADAEQPSGVANDVSVSERSGAGPGHVEDSESTRGASVDSVIPSAYSYTPRSFPMTASPNYRVALVTMCQKPDPDALSDLTDSQKKIKKMLRKMPGNLGLEGTDVSMSANQGKGTSYCEYTVPNMRAYTKQHGYVFFNIQLPPKMDLADVFGLKSIAVRELLKRRRGSVAVQEQAGRADRQEEEITLAQIFAESEAAGHLQEAEEEHHNSEDSASSSDQRLFTHIFFVDADSLFLDLPRPLDFLLDQMHPKQPGKGILLVGDQNGVVNLQR